MILLIQTKLLDPQFVAMLLVAFATAATVWTLAMPLVESDGLAKRMKAVASSDRIRSREARKAREEPVEAFAPSGAEGLYAPGGEPIPPRSVAWHGDREAKLTMAGYRGQQAEVTFLFFRLVTPIGFF